MDQFSFFRQIFLSIPFNNYEALSLLGVCYPTFGKGGVKVRRNYPISGRLTFDTYFATCTVSRLTRSQSISYPRPGFVGA
jgi:hypothetical protein